MSGLYAAYGSDKNLERDGVWYKAMTLEDGREVKFLLARMGGSNKRFEIASENAAKPYRRSIRKDTIKAEQAKAVAMQAFINGCLLDWENVEDMDGEVLSYSKENARKLFEMLPDLYDDLIDIATSREVYAAEIVEADSKN